MEGMVSAFAWDMERSKKQILKYINFIPNSTIK